MAQTAAPQLTVWRHKHSAVSFIADYLAANSLHIPERIGGDEYTAILDAVAHAMLAAWTDGHFCK